jgi:hypothetical protein
VILRKEPLERPRDATTFANTLAAAAHGILG